MQVGQYRASVCCSGKHSDPRKYVEKGKDGCYREVDQFHEATVFDTLDYLFNAEHVNIQKTFPNAFIVPVQVSVSVELINDSPIQNEHPALSEG